MDKKNQEFMISFADGQAEFINEIVISDNIKFEKREEFLYCDNAILGHTGTQTYYDYEMGGLTNKRVKLNKFREDFLKDDAISTIVGKSITRGHPRTDDGKVQFVDGKNFKELELGTVLDAWRDGDDIRGKLVIKEPDAIIDILSGDMKSLSLGYKARVEKFGDEYKQCDFYFNHVAMVKQGRAERAMIVDEKTVTEEEPTMGISKELLSKIQSGDAKITEDGKYVEFVDEKHITQRVEIVETTDVYDYDTGESSREVKTHTKEKSSTVENETIKLGDEKLEEIAGDLKEEEIKDKLEEELEVKKPDSKESKEDDDKENKEENKEKENKEKEYGDEAMTKEQLDTLKAEMKAEIIADMKKNQPDAFGDINPLESKKEEPKGFKLDFQKDERLRKELWDKATNPVRHDGDWGKLAQARKQLF